MKFAVPLSGGVLSAHFGHCEQFALIDVDEKSKKIVSNNVVASPGHQPGFLPEWLAGQGVNVVIAGGMGSRAQDLFNQSGIRVITGAPGISPEKIVSDYLSGTLATGDNVCDH